MNRLILLGNGFDLAHGLKTSYTDFIIWYLKDAFTKAYNEHKYEDVFIGLERVRLEEVQMGVIRDIPKYIDYYYKHDLYALLYNKDLYVAGTVYHPFFSVKIKSKFWERLVLTCLRSNWVDIENEFYEELMRLLTISHLEQKEAGIKKLNQAMEGLISILEKYLQNIDPMPVNEEYLELFKSEISMNEIVTVKLGKNEIAHETQVLNFNYTSTVENYFQPSLKMVSDVNYRVNYIHGKLGDPKNRLIFGFGDEMDERYLKMKLEKTEGFLEYIKTFWYLKTSNYHDLIRFIDADDFQVFILGHSCGLSDRTMLNMIFEHENCKSIKIFYYNDKAGNNNFKNLTQEISKHFTNEGVMRKKIVPFDKSSPMPQIEG